MNKPAIAAPCARVGLGAAIDARAQGTAESASRAGPYVLAAAGRSQHDYDCFLFACDATRGNATMLGLGQRFDVIGVEAGWMDHGKANTRNLGGPLRVRQAGVSAVWTARWGPYVEGLLRAGGAQAQLSYATGGFQAVCVTQTHFEPTVGLGLGVVVAPAVSVQLAWDLVRGRGDTTDVVAQTVTLGLKLWF